MPPIGSVWARLALGYLSVLCACASAEHDPSGVEDPNHLQLPLPQLRAFQSSGSRRLPGDDSDGDIETWLASLLIEVPDGAIAPLSKTFPLIFGAKVTVSVTLHDLTCSNLHIGRDNVGGLTSSTSWRTLAVSLQKVEVHCTAELSYDSSLGLSGSAKVNILTTDAEVSVSATLNTSDAGSVQIPDQMHLSQCSSDARLQLKIVSGTTWTELVKYVPSLSSWLEKEVSKALSDYSCQELLPSLEKKANCALVELARRARWYLRPRNPVPFPVNDALVRWQDEPLMVWLQHFQDQFISPHMPFGGQLCLAGNHTHCLQPSGVCLVGTGAGQNCLLPSMPANSTAVRVDLDAFEVLSGLDHLTAIRPGNSTWATSLGLSTSSITLAVDVAVTPPAAASAIKSKLGLEFEINALSLAAETLAAMQAVGWESLASFHYFYPPCLAPLIQNFTILELEPDLHVGSVALQLLRNTDKPSPLLPAVVQLANNAVAVGLTYHTGLAEVFAGWVRHNATDLLNEQLASFVSNSLQEPCPSPMGEESNEGTRLIRPHLAEGFLLAGTSLAILAGVLPTLLCWPALQSRLSQLRRRLQTPLCCSQSVPSALGVALPLMVLACTAFFICANFLLTAETYVALELRSPEENVESGMSLNVFQVMVYSLLFSIRKLYHEPTLRFLSIVLLIFSGILPYLKLVLMFLCWVCPTKVLSRLRRGAILLFLDQFGKYSLIDVFVLQFISGGLYTVIRLNTDSPVPGVPEPSVALRTRDEIGFFAFVMATVGSLIVGHVCLNCHQRDPIVRLERLSAGSMSHALHGCGRQWLSLQEAGRLLRGRRQWHLGLLFSMAFLAVAFGTTQKCFTVRLLSPLGEFAEASYSLITFAAAIPEVTLQPNAFSTRFSQGVFISFAILNIHIHMLLLLAVWFCRVKRRWLYFVNTLAQSLAAWSATDVVLISMVITLIELTTSHFVDLPDNVMASLKALMGKPLEADTGLKVDVVLEPGTYILAVGVVLHAVVGRAIMRLLTDAATAVQAEEQERLLNNRDDC
mmetsp:Transcript_19326/g.43433  ORF Transcript_19326/g.43433 Transcript_19326/m.43433 type:complete len:1035 (-) Transcript_19326:116-3220(-)